MNNNNNNVFYLKNHKVYNTLYPENSYNANLGRTKIINKGVIKLHKKKEKEKKLYNNTQKENNPTHKLKHWGFVIRKKRLKLQLEVYTTYQDNFLKYSSNIQIIIFIKDIKE